MDKNRVVLSQDFPGLLVQEYRMTKPRNNIAVFSKIHKILPLIESLVAQR